MKKYGRPLEIKQTCLLSVVACREARDMTTYISQASDCLECKYKCENIGNDAFRLVESLSNQGCLRKVRGDRHRHIYLQITDKGRNVLQTERERWRTFIDELTASGRYDFKPINTPSQPESVVDIYTLGILGDVGEISGKAIYEAIYNDYGWDPPLATFYDHLDMMGRRSLIRRRNNPDDNRGSLLTITEVGKVTLCREGWRIEQLIIKG